MRPTYDLNTDYFAILGVHYGACSKTVKLAYRKMARRYHPDVSKIHDAQTRFQEIALAYEILSKYRDAYCREYDLRQVQSRAKPKSRSSEFKAKPNKKRKNSDQKAEQSKQKKTADDFKQNQQQKTNYQEAYRSHKPIDGKDRVITYPITLRYAIRLLKLGSFYIPGLKVKMKFTRKAFEEKTFRLEGKGYSGLFGGKPGDYLVKFNIKIDTDRYKLKDGDIYSTFLLPNAILKPGKIIKLDTVSGKVELTIPLDYSSEQFIKIDGRGLPADEEIKSGDLYARLVVN